MIASSSGSNARVQFAKPIHMPNAVPIGMYTIREAVSPIIVSNAVPITSSLPCNMHNYESAKSGKLPKMAKNLSRISMHWRQI